MKYFPIALFVFFIHIPLFIYFLDIPLYESEGLVFMVMTAVLAVLSIFNKSSYKKALIVLILMIGIYLPFEKYYFLLLDKNKIKYSNIASVYKIDVNVQGGHSFIKTDFLRLKYFYQFNQDRTCVKYFGRPFKETEVCKSDHRIKGSTR